MSDSTRLPITDRRTKPRRLLTGLANFAGPLAPDIKRRLRAVIENPTSATWEDAHGLILTPGLGITLWNAVCCVDPTFPMRGPGQDERGRRRAWPRVPDQLTIVRDPRRGDPARRPQGGARADAAERPLSGPQLAQDSRTPHGSSLGGAAFG
jgi:hypothetical protein